MKRYFLIFSVFTLLAGSIYAQQLNLDTVIEHSARAVEEVLQQGVKVAILNFASTSETFSDHVIEELTGKLVNGRKITIVDRRNLALITQEMNLQLSGDVSDESAQAIGRMLGAQSIVSGTLTNMGTFYRFRVRVINVETAAIQTQASFDLRNDEQVAFLLSGNQATTQPAITGGTAPGTTTQTIEGTIVPGSNLTEKLAWLQRSADSHNTYILEVRANENIAPHTFEYKGAINITIVLKGDNINRTIRLRSNGTMFTVNSNVTFILENNITLQGHNGNNAALVNINGGTFRMRTGATISSNTNHDTSGNNLSDGVRVSSGSFEMTGGNITGNRRGVRIDARATFTMSGGNIISNGTDGTVQNGGGVFVGQNGNFTMSGGTISGNHARNRGGGLLVNGTFNMRGGTITGNSAVNDSGGVHVWENATFNKTGGTITGYNSDQVNGNVVKDEAGNVLARKGHAVFVNENLRLETTAGTGRNLSNRDSGRWD